MSFPLLPSLSATNMTLLDRFGSLISQHNPEVLRAVMSLALFMKVSSATDTLFYALLSSPAPHLSPEEMDRSKTLMAVQAACDAIDPSRPAPIEESFAAWFVAENRRCLTDSAAYLTKWFEERGFKVYPANAGHFLWVDFGDRVGWDTWERELEGFNEVFNQRIYIVSRPCAWRENDYLRSPCIAGTRLRLSFLQTGQDARDADRGQGVDGQGSCQTRQVSESDQIEERSNDNILRSDRTDKDVMLEYQSPMAYGIRTSSVSL